MTFKSKVQWFAIFAVLTVFSISMVNNLTGASTNRALADSIRGDKAMSANSKFAIVPNDDSNQGFLSQFTKLFEKDKLCSVTEDQYQALSSLFTTSTKTVTVNGQDVTVITVSGNTNPGQLKKIVDDTRCKVLKSSNLLYLLASFQIS